MKARYRPAAILSLIVCTLVASLAYGWGFEGHAIITRKACDAMPASVRAFFVEHRDALASRSAHSPRRKSSP